MLLQLNLLLQQKLRCQHHKRPKLLLPKHPNNLKANKLLLNRLLFSHHLIPNKFRQMVRPSKIRTQLRPLTRSVMTLWTMAMIRMKQTKSLMTMKLHQRKMMTMRSQQMLQMPLNKLE